MRDGVFTLDIQNVPTIHYRTSVPPGWTPQSTVLCKKLRRNANSKPEKINNTLKPIIQESLQALHGSLANWRSPSAYT